ncbi:MAG: hypothetical protein VXV86_03535, partial [Verrucomicrobiota bacterium]|nr:hypothetical protein [Verrucomicrobiota bacterium]
RSPFTRFSVLFPTFVIIVDRSEANLASAFPFTLSLQSFACHSRSNHDLKKNEIRISLDPEGGHSSH